MNETLVATGKPQVATRFAAEGVPRPQVLIVDDEESFRSTFADILDARGYDCKAAASVQEAISIIEQESADIYLVDLKLPDGTGLDILAKIRECRPAAETVILTGFASLPTAVQALNLGAFGYLEKPYNIDRLFITLERALERQRMVKRLHNSETAYSQLLQASGVAIFSFDTATLRVRNANPAFSRLLGYSPDEIDRLSAADLLSDSLRKRLASPAATRARRPQPKQTFEAPLCGKGGSLHWFSISAIRLDHSPSKSGLTAEEDSGTELLLVCNDISTARREMNELEKHRDFLETILSGIPCGIAIVDSNYRVTYANPAYCRFLELSREDLIDRACHEVFSHYQSPCSMFGELCPIAAARTTGTVGRVCREHQARDGHRRQIECSASPLKDRLGNVTSFVIVINDVSDLKAAECRIAETSERLGLLNTELSLRQQELEEHASHLKRANVELLKLSNAKGEFVATVSHELRTPLTAIAEGINLVGDGSLGTLNPDQQSFLQLAHRNCRRLADLINDVLDLSKIEAGRLELSPRVLEPDRLVNDVVVSYQNLAKERGISLTGSVPAEARPVIADEQAAQRILVNLVGNAIKFTPAGGSIIVRCQTPQTSPGTCPGADVVFSVEDTGIGIPEDDQHRIFGKFEQVTQSDGMRPQGTGLGLALTRQLVEMNQGRIWLESAEGKGTRFFFSLPPYEEYCYLTLSLQRFFERARTGNEKRRPAVYLFELQRPDQLPAVREVLAQVEEIVRMRLPHADTIAPLLSRRSLFAFAPAGLTSERYQALLDSLQGASFFSTNDEVRVSLQAGMLELEDGDSTSAGLQALGPKLDGLTPQQVYEQLRELLRSHFKELR